MGGRKWCPFFLAVFILIPGMSYFNLPLQNTPELFWNKLGSNLWSVFRVMLKCGSSSHCPATFQHCGLQYFTKKRESISFSSWCLYGSNNNGRASLFIKYSRWIYFIISTIKNLHWALHRNQHPIQSCAYMRVWQHSVCGTLQHFQLGWGWCDTFWRAT